MYIEPQGRSLKATGVPTSSDKSGQVATSSDKLRQVATSSDLSRVVPTSWAGHPQRIPDTQDTARGSWDLPEAASDQHNTVSQGPGTFRAVSEGPGTFRKQRQTIGIDTKMTEIMKIIQNGPIWLEMS